MKPKHLKSTTCRHKRHGHAHHGHTHHHHHPLQQLEFQKPESTTDEEDDIELISKDIDGSCSVLTWNTVTSANDEEGVIEIKMGVDEDDPVLNSIREKREQLIERLRIYNNLLKFHKAIKEDQVYLYRKLQEMDELYLRNTAVILRLGFCPCLVHQQTSPVGDKLMKIHRNLRVWDKKMEGICEVVKESSTCKSATAVLNFLKICEAKKLGRPQDDFNDVALPEIVWDLNNPFIEQIDLPGLTEEWRRIRIEVRSRLCAVEIKFQEICLEFGVRRGPAATPSGRKSISYSASLESNRNGTEVSEAKEIYRNEEEETVGRGEESSKVSSSFL
ncbi:hypothetical protein Ocin01_06230 [Orchesella cincta]|uniref:Uncharacterized protein n=1 Tax=Orchesella cincta TaxID=48709 RepID=A0A1D2N5B5_ORCCI|nr:hypothetical protein Ocin01_06230 [Orchesella cincta]